MEPDTLRQLRGAKDLLEDAIEAAAVTIGDARFEGPVLPQHLRINATNWTNGSAR